MDAADDFGGALRQGAAAQPSGLVSEGGRGDSVPGEGGVGGDETVHAHVQRDVYRFLQGFVGQIRRNLEEERTDFTGFLPQHFPFPEDVLQKRL